MNEENKKTILVIDDDIDLLTQTEINLTTAGFNVVAVDSQEEAENYLRYNKPDLVISDLMMEALDSGFALSHYIKKKNPTVPVIVVTGVATDTGMKLTAGSSDAKETFKCDEILYKPVKFEDLLRTVEKYL